MRLREARASLDTTVLTPNTQHPTPNPEPEPRSPTPNQVKLRRHVFGQTFHVQFLHTSMRSVIDFTHLDFALVLTCPSAVTNLASGKGALTNPASGETALTNALWRGLDGQLPVGAGKGARTAATNC